ASVRRPLAAAHLSPCRGRAPAAEAVVGTRVGSPPVGRRRVCEGAAARVRLQQLDLHPDAVERGREAILTPAPVAGAEAGEVVVAATGAEPSGLDVRLRERDVAAYVLGGAFVDVR